VQGCGALAAGMALFLQMAACCLQAEQAEKRQAAMVTHTILWKCVSYCLNFALNYILSLS
jgi:hypothetical protein